VVYPGRWPLVGYLSLPNVFINVFANVFVNVFINVFINVFVNVFINVFANVFVNVFVKECLPSVFEYAYNQVSTDKPNRKRTRRWTKTIMS
jgi:hypothetical protein